MLTDFVHMGDVGIVQGRGRTGFLFESTKSAGVRGHLLGQDFDSDITTPFKIAGLVHFRPTARTQLGENLVAEAGAGLEGHGV